MSLYPAAPTGYYDRLYSRYTTDIYPPTLLTGNGDEKTLGDWSAGTAGLGFSTSGPYGMMMTSSYEQFARNVLPPEVEMAGAHAVDFMSGGGVGRFNGGSARLKPEPEVTGSDQLQHGDSSDTSTTGSETVTAITAAPADTSGNDDVSKEKLNDGNDVIDTAGGHVFAPDTEHHGHERHCLLWACKTCKKRTAAAVDRRKVLLVFFLPCFSFCYKDLM